MLWGDFDNLEAIQNSEEEQGTQNSVSVPWFSLSYNADNSITPSVCCEDKIGQWVWSVSCRPICACCDGGVLSWPSLPGLWFCSLFFFIKQYNFQGEFWRLDYMHGRHSYHSCGSFTQCNSVTFTEKILSSRYRAKGKHRPCVLIYPPALCFDRLADFLKNWVFIYILSNHLPIKESSEKYPVEMRNREEMRQNEPGKWASWNVGAVCPEIPVYQEACTTWHPKEGECGVGCSCCYLPVTSKILGITLRNF